MNYKYNCLNPIAACGLNNLTENYARTEKFEEADAVFVRSAKMDELTPGANLLAVARAGAGVNNIPHAEYAKKGIVVFNTPGANANAVKELVLLGLLISSRQVVPAIEWVQTLKGEGDAVGKLVEKGKSQFVGPELKGKTLGVIGLGAIGAMVANTAIELGMKVIGYDPYLSVDAAWSLSRAVQKAESLDALLSKCDYITVHIPQTNDTKGFINAERINTMKKGVRLINLARGGLVVNKDILAAIEAEKIALYVSDFADEELLKNDKVICLPHLGASTPEAEENCAVMAVNQLRDFLENGNIVNSVNFPKCRMDAAVPKNGTRVCIANKNIPNMVGQITTVLADAKCNISAMVNQNRADVAYNIIDVENKLDDSVAAKLSAIDGIISVRLING